MPYYLLKEDDFKLLQEDDASRFILEGIPEYSREELALLPGNDTDLATYYSDQDYINVSSYDGVRVGQVGTLKYMVHQFKNRCFCKDGMTVTWKGRSTLAPSSSEVKLQVYNLNTTSWDDLDSDNTTGANTDFTLTSFIADLTDYVNPADNISCRVYQLAT